MGEFLSIEGAAVQERRRRVMPWLFGSRGSVLDTISSHENNYNIIRVILAASVIWFHSAYIAGSAQADWISQHLHPITDLGGLAVQCFFFLSGLFVAQSIYKDNRLLDFSIKRFMRIFPGLFVCLVLTTLMLALATYGWRFWRALAIPETYEYITSNAVLDLKWSIPSLIPDNPSTTINGSIHTLPTELKMYGVLALLGVIGAAGKKYRLTIAASLLLVAMAVAGNSATAVVQAPADAYAMIMMFVAGMFAFSVAAKIRVNLAQGLILLGLFLLSKRIQWLHPVAFYAEAIWAMFFVGQLPILRRWLKPKVDPSYGIYIYGWPCEQLVKTLMPSATMGVITLLALVLAYFVARFSWAYVEKPCMDMAKAICRKSTLRSHWFVNFSGGHSWSRSFYAVLATLFVCLMMQFFTAQHSFLPVQTMASSIVDFGPHEALAKTGFSVQPDGSSALWIHTDVAVPKDALVVFQGHRLQTVVDASAQTLTAEVPAALIRKPGNQPIYLRSVTANGISRSNTVVLKLKDN